MNPMYQKAIISGLISGVVYATIMYAMDYFNEKAFNVWKFVFYTLFFGFCMGWTTYRGLKKSQKENNKN